MVIDVLPRSTLVCDVFHAAVKRLANGPDLVYIQTNLPNPCPPYTGSLVFQTVTAAGTGEDWCRAMFGKDFEVSVEYLGLEKEGGLKRRRPILTLPPKRAALQTEPIARL